MRQFDGLNGQFVGQMSRILNLNTVIENSDSDTSAGRIQLAVAQGIGQRLAQRLKGNLQLLFTVKAFSEAARIDSGRARAVMKVMERRGVLVRLGKEGRAVTWGRV